AQSEGKDSTSAFPDPSHSDPDQIWRTVRRPVRDNHIIMAVILVTPGFVAVFYLSTFSKGLEKALSKLIDGA
ncbi:hypothetical protein, partial [Lactobacillus sp. HBUAS51381]|uniref:hypothetical protein n=1 Tax=Lactobacillus sp. HBUAS51381 TaxID=2722743 RepID=UPI001B3B2409